MPFATVSDRKIYFEFTGPEDKPLILQFGGSLFGRHNFDGVNDHLRKNFRLLSYDPSGYGQSDQPSEFHTIEGWADEAAGLLDQLGIDRTLVLGTSMGGMIGIAFTGKYPEKTIAAAGDCCMARADLYRRTMFRVWRHVAESMPLDDFCDLLVTQTVSASYLEEHPEIYDEVRYMVSKNSPFLIRQAILACERVDIEHLARQITRPILFTNGTNDILCPPRLAQSGFSTSQIVDVLPEYARLHEFPQIGHGPLLEAPEESVGIITDFFHEMLEKDASGSFPIGAPAWSSPTCG